MGVGVAGDVEPVAGHLLAIVRRRQVPIDHLLVRLRRLVREVLVHFLHGRRQPGERKRHAADECLAVSLSRRLQPFLLHPRQQERIDRVENCGVRAWDRGHFGPGDRLEGPVLLVFRTLFDPQADSFLLLVRQLLVRVRRRHYEVFVDGRDARPRFAGFRVAWLDRRETPPLRKCPLGRVEPELRLARFGVEAVTCETRIGEDRPHIAVELDHPAGWRCWCGWVGLTEAG